MKSSNCSLVPSPLAKTVFYSYLVENNQKAMLNFYFKLRSSMKPSKFQIFFAKIVALWNAYKKCKTMVYG